MARKPRVHFPGALYHVISGGNQRQDIFLDDQDLSTFLSYLSEYKIRYPFHLYAYSLMKNHFHLLLEVEGVPFGKKKFLARRRYRRFVVEGLPSGHPGKYDAVKDPRFLGEDSFMDRIEVEKKDGEVAVYDIPKEVISQEVSRATGIAQSRRYLITFTTSWTNLMLTTSW